MRRTWRASLAMLAFLQGCRAEGDRTVRAHLSLLETLAGTDTAGYARARDPRSFDFPSDHQAHPTFRTEWWYVTGNVSTMGGREFGFQLTIFRDALAPSQPQSASAWATNQAYMAHFAVTDIGQEHFYAYERFARGAAGLAGAEGDPLRIWLGNWVLESETAETFPLRLTAEADDASVRLDLGSGKPVVLQGEGGLSRKGPEPGNASYYYSYTRLPVAGAVAVGADTLSVTGAAWLDREWSTSALTEDLVGWDWFALQLSDGWDLMIYRLRHRDGSADPRSYGVLVDPLGAKSPMDWGTDVTMASTGSWTSPVDGAQYPSGWRITVPARGWDLSVLPRIPDQEIDLAFRYWEGAVGVRGRGEGGASVEGRGYVELTGYAGEVPER